MRRYGWVAVAAAIAGLAVLPWVGCGDDTTSTSGTFSGTVQSAEGTAVAGATVYLVPTTAINMTQITASGVFTSPYPAEGYDEPLEDTVAASGSTFKQATTDSGGGFSISDIPSGKKFFVYVKPAASDAEHLPGGDKCRTSYLTTQLAGTSMTIKLSSSPSSSATYVGSKNCLTCHASHNTIFGTAHKIGILPTGTPKAQQSLTNYPAFNNALAKFPSASSWSAAASIVLELGDFNGASTGFDKFKIKESTDTGITITTVQVRMYLWKHSTTGKYYISVQNARNSSDPLGYGASAKAGTATDLEVKFTYGGAVYKQRYLVDVSPLVAGRTGLYFTLQYNTEGSTSRIKSSRRVWRDYKFGDFSGTYSNPPPAAYTVKGFYGPGADGRWDAGDGGTDTDNVLGAPPVTKTFQGECAACHFTGYERYTAGNGEYLARAADNADGEANIDDDASTDEMNVGCEACHGAGSEHVAANSARYVVAPRSLSPERESTICGRCHDRPKGKDGTEQTVNTSYKMMPPGQSRATFLSDYCSSTQKGPKPKTDSSPDVWGDDLISKSHHQQFSDHIKSAHYKNDRILVTCSDCHEPHGGTPYRHQLKGEADSTSSGGLCVTCHNADWAAHTMGHAYMSGYYGRCVECHMPKTAQSGSGRFGAQRTAPDDADGSPTWYTTSTLEDNGTYWENDISSHVFKVPGKSHVSVAGITPASAMPIPYTNSCATGSCHTLAPLWYP